MASIATFRRVAAGFTAVALFTAGCSTESLPEGRPDVTATSEPGVPAATTHVAATTPTIDSTSSDDSTDPTDPTTPEAVADADVVAVIRADDVIRAIDPRLFGTNLPAWLGPETLADPSFRATTAESGVTVVRMPGGSWSNAYDWLACENGTDGCFWTWAARPSDFADFIESTGIAGMWTVSINSTAETAAAAVAFFNGSVDDDRPIGVDRNGVDWATVGTWARLRAENGHPDPVRIELWEVGNEVYGGRPDAGGDECASFGWEDVWTCDGAEYIEGDAQHDGYLATRTAMRNVDPSISVGAVGVGEPSSWSNWGNEIIEGSGADLDYYVVHQYGFDQSPSGADAVQRPGEIWPGSLDGLRDVLPPETLIAFTEYNLVSFAAGDTEQMMTRAANALYIADTIGQMAVSGVAMANQWNLANGTAEGGTDYGMIDVTDGSVFPQYHAMRLWSMAGDSLVGHDVVTSDQTADLRIYPTRHADGSLAVVVTNLGSGETTLGLDVTSAGSSATLTTVRATDLTAVDLVDEVSGPITVVDGRTQPIVLPPWSINVVEVSPRG